MCHLSQPSSGRSSGGGVPVIPLPNPGEGGPVEAGGRGRVIPRPPHGAGAPVASGAPRAPARGRTRPPVTTPSPAAAAPPAAASP